MFMAKKIGCIILAAGSGARMKSALPKPLHKVAGLPMIKHVIHVAETLNPEKIVVVVGPGMETLAEAARPHVHAIQVRADGTGGAARAAASHFQGFDGDILILFSDTPLVTAGTMQKMVDARCQLPGIGIVFSGMRVTAPNTYGRMLVGQDGYLERIVEFKDATEAEKSIDLCNGGIVCAEGASLFKWLDQVGNDNAQKEFYLTDLPVIARRDNRQACVVEVPPEEMAGVNSRADLAAVETLAQRRLRDKHMKDGATLIDPETVFFSYDTELGQDVIIEPNVFFGPGVRIGSNVVIHSFSHLEGAEVAEHTSIGPFARLRPGTKIGAHAKVGNFVETKNSVLGVAAKASHLSYLGDTEVGEGANIGAGTITCNYDGENKHRTIIGKDAFVGSNTALVAPVTVGEGAVIAAGSTITKDVPPGALAIGRARQENLEGRAKKRGKKDKKEE